MQIYKSNLNFGRLKDPSVSVNKINPFCGDHVILDLKVKNGVVEDARFEGNFCAVSKVSASLLTEYLKGKKINDLRNLTERDVLEVINFNLTETRKQCALLCYFALLDALDVYERGNKYGKQVREQK